MTRKQIVSDEQAEELVKRLYDRASAEEPSSDIDQQILARAKAAAESGQEASPTTGKSPLQFWQRFGSIAATLVLVVTVGMLYQQNRNQLAPENPVILTSDPAGMGATGRQNSGAETAQQNSAASLADDTDQVPAEKEMAEPIKQQQPEAGKMQNEPAADKAPAAQKALSTPAADRTAPVPQKAPPAPSAAESLFLEKRSVKTELAEPALEESTAIGELYDTAPDADSRVTTEDKAGHRIAPGMMRSFSAGPQPAAPVPEKESTEAPDVEKIREAIAAGEFKKAEALWQEFKAANPDRELPRDLVEFFGNDHQIGQPQQIDSNSGGNQHQ